MRYSAFISYSHADQRWARWLHRALETYRFPRRLRGLATDLGTLGPRLPPVFRDSDELAASADLGTSIRAALEQSDTLIVICSPRAARSHWVDQEIAEFISLGRGDRVRCVIVEGEPNASDPEQECFPPALRQNGAIEPLAVDLRPGHDSRQPARLRLIAGILGISYDDLRQREATRHHRRLAAAAAVLAVSLMVVSGLAVFALISRDEAVRQRDLAEQRTMTAQRTVAFVKDLFMVSDPSEARGRTMTVAEVLERGVTQIRTGLADQPAVRADLGATLGEVYISLGLFDEADRLVRWTLTIPHGETEVRVRQLAVLADARLRLGDVDLARRSARDAVELGKSLDALDPALLTRTLVTLGEVEIEAGDFARARAALEEARQRELAREDSNGSDLALVLENLAQIALFEADLPSARDLVSRALLIRREAEGEMSPSVSDNVIALARIASQQGNSAEAERLILSRVAIDERVLGQNHPALAEMLNDLGRAQLEQRKYGDARRHLERAASILRGRSADGSEQAMIILTNLGMVYRGLGMDTSAEATLGDALGIANGLDDPVRGLIMVELADLRCRSGRARSGQSLYPEAREIIAESFPDQPWRSAWADLVLGGCLIRSGDRVGGDDLVRRSIAPIRERWTVGTHFRTEADRRLTEARTS